MPQDSAIFMSTKKFLLIGGIFYLLFLLLTPLGLFNDWIPPLTHSGYYSVKTVDGGDDTGYYSYLRSIFFDGDIDFINERYYAHINRFHSTGYVFSTLNLILTEAVNPLNTHHPREVDFNYGTMK